MVDIYKYPLLQRLIDIDKAIFQKYDVLKLHNVDFPKIHIFKNPSFINERTK